MQSVAESIDTSVSRPTQLIAEALLEQHDSGELILRAERLGFSQDITEAVVAVCCRNRQDEAGAGWRIRTSSS